MKSINIFKLISLLFTFVGINAAANGVGYVPQYNTVPAINNVNRYDRYSGFNGLNGYNSYNYYNDDNDDYDDYYDNNYNRISSNCFGVACPLNTVLDPFTCICKSVCNRICGRYEVLNKKTCTCTCKPGYRRRGFYCYPKYIY